MCTGNYFKEICKQFPQVDGFIVRVGENYLYDSLITLEIRHSRVDSYHMVDSLSMVRKRMRIK